MSETKKEPTKRVVEKEPTIVHYVLQEKYYRQGRIFMPGEVVGIPDTEEPAKNWRLLSEVKAEQARAAAEAVPVFTNIGRSSDKEI